MIRDRAIDNSAVASMRLASCDSDLNSAGFIFDFKFVTNSLHYSYDYWQNVTKFVWLFHERGPSLDSDPGANPDWIRNPVMALNVGGITLSYFIPMGE